ncbi:hypothetical protein D3C78_920870 [compost metagenome]
MEIIITRRTDQGIGQRGTVKGVATNRALLHQQALVELSGGDRCAIGELETLDHPATVSVIEPRINFDLPTVSQRDVQIATLPLKLRVSARDPRAETQGIDAIVLAHIEGAIAGSIEVQVVSCTSSGMTTIQAHRQGVVASATR